MAFVLSSCTNKKEAAITAFNAFFDKETEALNAVTNADECLDYLTASDERFSVFFDQMDKQFPINENDELIDFSKTDSDAAMKVYNDRMDAYTALLNSKCEGFFEPFLSKLETLVNGLADDLMNNVEPAEDITDQILAAYDDIDKYGNLGSDDQAERFGDIDEMVKIIYGLDEEEAAE